MLRRYFLVRRAAGIGTAILIVLAMLAVLGPALAPIDPLAIAGEALRPPDSRHPFGTDDLGRDLLAGVLHGARISLIVAIIAAAISVSLGLLVGGIAGARGGALDQILMRATEFVQALPRFFVVVMVVSLFGSQLWLMVVVIGLTAWPATARVFRMQVMTTMGRDFAVAARAAGARDSAIVLRHALPLALPVLASIASYQAGGAILAEAGLSFLGLGDPTVVSWGTLLGSAQHFVREAWWMSVFPGAAITLTVLGCNLIADGIGGTP